MKKTLYFITLLMLVCMGMNATPTYVTVVDGVNQPYDYYGTRSNGTTFTSNATSGLAGLTIVAPVMDRANWWSTYCLALKPAAVQTEESVTITAPAGYKIYGYTIVFQAISSNNPYEITVGSTTKNVTGASAATFTQWNINATSTSFTIKQTSETNDWLAVKKWQLILYPENESFQAVASINDIVNGKTYSVICPRGAWGFNGRLAATTVDNIDYTAENAKVGFVKYNDAYYIYSPAEKKFLTKSNTLSTDNANIDAVTITDTEAVDYRWFFSYGDGLNVNMNNVPAIGISSWSTRDEGNQFALLENGSYDVDEAISILQGEEKVFVTDLANLSNEKVYVVYNKRGGWNFADNATAMTVTSTPDRSIDNQQVAIINYNDEYYLYSVNNQKFLRSTNTLGAPEAVQISATGNSDYPWFFKFDDSHNINVSDGNVLIDTWGTIDDGNSNAILEAGKYDLSDAIAQLDAAFGLKYVTDLSALSNGKAYVINNKRGTWNFTDGATQISATTTGVQVNAANQQVVIYKYNDKFYLYSVNAQKFVNRDKSLTALPQAVTIEQKGSADNYLWFFSFDSNHIINGGAGFIIIDNWNTPDDGNLHQIIEAADFTEDLSPYFELKEAVATNLTSWFTTNVGNYFGLSQEAHDENVARYQAALSTCTPEEYETLANAVANGISYPETGYYRIKSTGQRSIGESYIGCTADGLKTIAKADALKDASTVLKLTESGSNYTISTEGLFVQSQADFNANYPATEGETGAEFYFQIMNPGIVAIQDVASYSSSSTSYPTYTYFHEAANLAVVRWEANATPSQWTVEDATALGNGEYALDVALRDGGDGKSYGTLYLPFAVDLGEEVVNAITVNGTSAINAVVGSTLPANTGALLISENGTTTLQAKIIDSADAFETAMTGSNVDVEVDANSYVFSKVNGKLGFYKPNSGKSAANKAYLHTETSFGIKGFTLEDEATGINTIENGKWTIENENVYNLQGQKVNRTQKGVYIVNGKKVVMK